MHTVSLVSRAWLTATDQQKRESLFKFIFIKFIVFDTKPTLGIHCAGICRLAKHDTLLSLIAIFSIINELNLYTDVSEMRSYTMKFKVRFAVICIWAIIVTILCQKLLCTCWSSDAPRNIETNDLIVVDESQFVPQTLLTEPAWKITEIKAQKIYENISYSEEWIKQNKDGSLEVQNMGKNEKYIVNSPRCKIPHILPFDDRYPLMREHFKREHFESCDHGNNRLTVFKDGVLRFDDKVRKKYYPSWKVRMHGFYRQQYAP